MSVEQVEDSTIDQKREQRQWTHEESEEVDHKSVYWMPNDQDRLKKQEAEDRWFPVDLAWVYIPCAFEILVCEPPTENDRWNPGYRKEPRVIKFHEKSTSISQKARQKYTTKPAFCQTKNRRVRRSSGSGNAWQRSAFFNSRARDKNVPRRAVARCAPISI